MNAFLYNGLYFLATSAIVLIAIYIFDLITKYKVWEEINVGNIAVALSTGGIVLGVANIMRFAIISRDDIPTTMLWGGIGTVALLLVYLAFELLTPKLNVNDEIGKGNKAVGLISFIFSVAFSYIIGASIT